MAQQVTDYLLGHGVSPVLVVFIISLMPILELRGGLIAAGICNLSPFVAAPVCLLGTILPVPFILLFIRQIFKLFKKIGFMRRLIEKIEDRTVKKSEKIRKNILFGLFLFVAIPLPGTGAWTGSLIADFLDIRMRKSLPVIIAGCVVACLIMSVLTYGFKYVIS